MVTAYVGIGSNLGNPRGQVERALRALRAIERSELLARSNLYRTAPWGVIDQPEFVNAVAQLNTDLSPRELMNALLGIEASFGRERNARWGPRVIDLDLLVHGNAQIDEADLHLPHRQMHRRAFVMVPLADLAPDLLIQGHGSVRELARKLDDATCILIDGDARAGIENPVNSTNSVSPEKFLTDL